MERREGHCDEEIADLQEVVEQYPAIARRAPRAGHLLLPAAQIRRGRAAVRSPAGDRSGRSGRALQSRGALPPHGNEDKRRPNRPRCLQPSRWIPARRPIRSIFCASIPRSPIESVPWHMHKDPALDMCQPAVMRPPEFWSCALHSTPPLYSFSEPHGACAAVRGRAGCRGRQQVKLPGPIERSYDAKPMPAAERTEVSDRRHAARRQLRRCGERVRPGRQDHLRRRRQEQISSRDHRLRPGLLRLR